MVIKAPFCVYPEEFAESKFKEKDEILNVGLISLMFGSIAALYSFLATSAIEWPLNESTIIPFLNLDKLDESRIVKSCLLNVSCSSRDNEV